PRQVEPYFTEIRWKLWDSWRSRVFRPLRLPDHQPAATGTSAQFHCELARVLHPAGIPHFSRGICLSWSCCRSLLEPDALVSYRRRASVLGEHGYDATLGFWSLVVVEYRGAVLSDLAFCHKAMVSSPDCNPARGSRRNTHISTLSVCF